MNDIAPTLPTSCGSLPPEGALRLRPGKAESAAPADVEAMPPRLSLRLLRCPPEGAATPAAHAGMCVAWVWDGRLFKVVMLSVPLRPFS